MGPGIIYFWKSIFLHSWVMISIYFFPTCQLVIQIKLSIITLTKRTCYFTLLCHFHENSEVRLVPHFPNNNKNNGNFTFYGVYTMWPMLTDICEVFHLILTISMTSLLFLSSLYKNLCVCVRVLDWLFVAPWTIAHQPPLLMGFSR